MSQAPSSSFMFLLAIFLDSLDQTTCFALRNEKGRLQSQAQQWLTPRNRKTKGEKLGSTLLLQSQAPRRATTRLHRPQNRDWQTEASIRAQNFNMTRSVRSFPCREGSTGMEIPLFFWSLHCLQLSSFSLGKASSLQSKPRYSSACLCIWNTTGKGISSSFTKAGVKAETEHPAGDSLAAILKQKTAEFLFESQRI